LAKIFPKTSGGGKMASQHVDIKAVPPSGQQVISLLAVVREIRAETKRTASLNALGAIGGKLLGLPKGPLQQVTLIVNKERPNLAYTCVVPPQVGLSKFEKNKMVFAQLVSRVAGDFAIWLATDIRVI
jgi:hypothetical protein